MEFLQATKPKKAKAAKSPSKKAAKPKKTTTKKAGKKTAKTAAPAPAATAWVRWLPCVTYSPPIISGLAHSFFGCFLEILFI